jgi:hypothetical protein
MTQSRLLAALALIFLPGFALAHTLHIEEPEVEAGAFSLHDIVQGDFDDDDAFSNEIEATYGFNDWIKGRLVHVAGKHESEEFDEYTGGEAGLQFELSQQQGYLPATAVYVAYGWHAQSDEPSNINVTGIFRERLGNFNHLLNLTLTRSVGEDSEGGISGSMAARSVYEYGSGCRVFQPPRPAGRPGRLR